MGLELLSKRHGIHLGQSMLILGLWSFERFRKVCSMWAKALHLCGKVPGSGSASCTSWVGWVLRESPGLVLARLMQTTDLVPTCTCWLGGQMLCGFLFLALIPCDGEPSVGLVPLAPQGDPSQPRCPSWFLITTAWMWGLPVLPQPLLPASCLYP